MAFYTNVAYVNKYALLKIKDIKILHNCHKYYIKNK